ncbi:MAG: hypothetical protein AAGA56_11735 [Myxococcota bacterium]
MKNTKRKTAKGRMARGAVLAAGLLGGTGMLGVGCLDRPIEPVDPRTTSTFVETLSQSAVDKIDILLVIDNSGSMADKQTILADAVPDLVDTLVNPRCVLEDGTEAPAAAGPVDDPSTDVDESACPNPESQRVFEPVTDIHIGIITSSIGGHGADICAEGAPSGFNPTQNDRGRLINRASAAEPFGATVPTYTDRNGTDLRFLAWDPEQVRDPVGESNSETLITNLGQLVQGTGEAGCGYEATLEAWYRFLVDPDPYEEIALNDANPAEAVRSGVDDTILEQRRNFLRPDSLLAVVMLTDENDCSIIDGFIEPPPGSDVREQAINYFPARTQAPMKSGSPQCAVDPNDDCCYSCFLGEAPPGCGELDASCAGFLSSDDDNNNLRCWEQKRRFGRDFLYPISRYVDGLTLPEVPTDNGDLTPNPLFQDLGGDGGTIRGPDLVFLAGIVGVPFQDIARQREDGTPDILAGLNADGEAVGGFMSAAELEAPRRGAEFNTWDLILGTPSEQISGDPTADPSAVGQPLDPLMRESTSPRTGVSPATEASLNAPGTVDTSLQLPNGSEYDTRNDQGAFADLQHACIFDLVNPVENGPDCGDAGDFENNPLCFGDQDGSGVETFGTTQYRAKAFPSTRQLQVLRGVGSNGIVGSICPLTIDPDDRDREGIRQAFGYRPAVQAIIERLSAELGGSCLPRSLVPDENGQVSCRILEALRNTPADQCEAQCGAVAGRSFPDPGSAVVEAARSNQIFTGTDTSEVCICQIEQLQGEELDACQNRIEDRFTLSGNENDQAVSGFCYVDAATVPPTGNTAIVDECPATERRILRFVGDAEPRAGAVAFITCAGE